MCVLLKEFAIDDDAFYSKSGHQFAFNTDMYALRNWFVRDIDAIGLTVVSENV